MARYIDADKAKLNLLSLSQSIQHSANISANDIAKSLPILLDNEPTADVQEVKHAHWVKSETDRQYCSICHEVRPYYFKETLVNRYAEQKKLSLINWECPYCPNCGAKMDGKGEGNV